LRDLRQERLRRRFRPPKVSTLFIGESPPASGRFFYQQDSGLYRAMLQAFVSANPGLTDETFLEAFRDAGCYLIDLCANPADALSPPLRKAARNAAEPSLARTIVKLAPPRIVTLLRAIEPNVGRAIARAGWSGERVSLPYPGRWKRHRETFVRELGSIAALLSHGAA